jgi:hypothetical protein
MFSTFQNNGRVNIKTPNTEILFKMKDKIPVNQHPTSYRNALNGLWNETELSNAFFSSKNIELLQNGIRYGVYNLSKEQYLIGPQNDDNLKIIMRSIYLQYGANQPNNITEQINELNKIVLNFCIQQVYNEAQGYLKYINDISTLVVPIEHPVMANNTDRTLEFKGWF